MASVTRMAAFSAIILLSLHVADVSAAGLIVDGIETGIDIGQIGSDFGNAVGSNSAWWQQWGDLCGDHCGRRMLGVPSGASVDLGKLRGAAARVDFAAAKVDCKGMTNAYLHDKLVTVQLAPTGAGLPHRSAAQAVGYNITMYTSRVASLKVPTQAFPHLTALDFCPVEGPQVVQYQAKFVDVKDNAGSELQGANASIRDCLIGTAVPIAASHNDTTLVPHHGPIVVALVAKQ